MNRISGSIAALFLLSNPLISAQQFTGKVIAADGTPVGYVNVGIAGRNVGTVTDIAGLFTIELQEKYDNDSLRFSMIGYQSQTWKVSDFKRDPARPILLAARTYNLNEVRISSRKFRKVTLGYPVLEDDLRSGFSENDLGSELGIILTSSKPVLIREICLNVGICTYDSVSYRLNIYKVKKNDTFENILTQPVYLRFKQTDTSLPVVIDLSCYSLQVEGRFLITLELYRNLGEGKLLFNTTFFTGLTYHRKVSQGSWTKSPGEVGITLNGLVIK